MSLKQGCGVLWRDQQKRSQGMKMCLIITKFIMRQNKHSVSCFFWYIILDLLNASDGG